MTKITLPYEKCSNCRLLEEFYAEKIISSPDLNEIHLQGKRICPGCGEEHPYWFIWKPQARGVLKEWTIDNLRFEAIKIILEKESEKVKKRNND